MACWARAMLLPNMNPELLDFLAGPLANAPFTLVLLALAALLAGFVDSIAGGGGIITVPALLAAGLPPHLALGTNKLQASFGSLSAALNYRAKGLVSFRTLGMGIGATALGSGAGTVLVSIASPGFLKVLIPVILGLVALFLLLRPLILPSRKTQDTDTEKALLSPTALILLGGLSLGFYDGFIGPGTGTFWVLLLVHLGAMELGAATARTKVFNFTSNVVSLAVFALAGSVLLLPGLVMGICQALGAQLGSGLAVRKGGTFIRIMLTLTTFAMLAWVIFR